MTTSLAAEIEVTRSDTATADERAAIVGGLVEYNDAHGGPDNHRGLALVARSDGRVVGGVIGDTHWNWLSIRLLWVSDDFRGAGLGRRLLAAAGSEAIDRGADHAHVDTFEFQALPFYEKLGYEVFGELANYPPGFRRFFLQKRDLRSSRA